MTGRDLKLCLSVMAAAGVLLTGGCSHGTAPVSGGHASIGGHAVAGRQPDAGQGDYGDLNTRWHGVAGPHKAATSPRESHERLHNADNTPVKIPRHGDARTGDEGELRKPGFGGRATVDAPERPRERHHHKSGAHVHRNEATASVNIKNVGSGQFIVMCDPTVTADADLLSPTGSVGHVHNFFGPQSLPKKGSTLHGGKVGNSCTTKEDQSAYWIPALLVAGQKVAPQRIQAYYRLSGGEVAPARGLGYATSSSASGPWARWLCVGNGTQREKVTANSCQKGEYLSARVTFPSCWNGVDRTTADQQHMHYPNEDGHCPPTHPTRVPQLELFAQWDCSVVCSGPRQVTLTSGHSSTLHGDVVFSWRKQALKRLISDCSARDCSIVTSPKK